MKSQVRYGTVQLLEGSLAFVRDLLSSLCESL